MILPLTIEFINPKPNTIIRKGSPLILKATNSNTNTKKDFYLGDIDVLSLTMTTAIGTEEVQIKVKNIEYKSIDPLSSVYLDAVFDSDYPLDPDFASTSLLLFT